MSVSTEAAVLQQGAAVPDVPQRPLVGIVGSAGAYGRWLQQFFRARMGLAVIGHDPADTQSVDETELVRRADVLVFSAPIRRTAALIDRHVVLAGGSEAGKLWLDVTSIKTAPVAAMLRSHAEVVGLHPMTTPPKAPTLRGRVMVVCEARLQRWRPWVADLLSAVKDDSGIAVTELRVDGGAAANDGLLQFQADLLGAAVVRPQVTETTALGAAYLAGLAVGFWDSPEALARHWRIDRRFEPAQPAAHAAARRAEWQQALGRAKAWVAPGA